MWVKGQERKRFAVTTLFKTQKWEIHSNFIRISIFEAICIYANRFYVSVRLMCRSAHFSIAHCNVPPLGINLHQGWGVRSVIEIGVVFYLSTGEKLDFDHLMTFKYSQEYHFVVISRCDMQVKITLRISALGRCSDVKL